jgi:alpha-D-ribose 1-methylphosphonate 5-triphosphate synthase subunit PhnH
MRDKATHSWLARRLVSGISNEVKTKIRFFGGAIFIMNFKDVSFAITVVANYFQMNNFLIQR